jgi:transcriptional regulator with XRE-family HTH domain
MLTAAQCRAARALLDWSQNDLAKEAGISAVSLSAFERGGMIRKRNAINLQTVLEAAGVEFISENGGGPGVRLKKVARDRPG